MPEAVTDLRERALWFLDNLAIVRSPRVDDARPVVIELVIPSGGSPPLHVHKDLDDAFLLLAGELLIHVDDSFLRFIRHDDRRSFDAR
jgi:hypothetical protein